MTAERDNQEPSGADVDITTVRTQAAFVNKLYKMLEDTSIQSLISWSERGDLFSVANPTSFSKTVLPQYFKHNNWQSFVRQLNMYGFHKVNDMIHSNLTSDNQTWEFKHPHFKRGDIEDLQNIKRKSTKPAYNASPRNSSNRASTETDDGIYGPMYKHILHIEDRLHHVTRSYEILKNETNNLKYLLTKQQETIGEFAMLLGGVLEGDGYRGPDELKKEIILSKLNELQTLFAADNTSQVSPTGQIATPPVDATLILEERRGSYSSSPTASRSMEQFLLSQQHLYQNPSLPIRSPDGKKHYNSSPPTHEVNRRMGFGRESYLLNPEPNANFQENQSEVNDNFTKKRRTE